jgi:coenzyme PQQ precursor peptide PqqA
MQHFRSSALLFFCGLKRREAMAGTTPVLVEIRIGLEINDYIAAFADNRCARRRGRFT